MRSERLVSFLRALSLRQKVFLSSAALLLLVVSLSSVAHWFVFIPMYTNRMKEYGVRVGQYLISRCRPHMIVGDVPAMNQVLHERISVDSEILYALIVNGEGTVIAHSFPEQVPPGLGTAAELRPRAVQHVRLVEVEDTAIYDVSLPVEDGPGDRWAIHVGLTKEPIDDAVTEMEFLVAALMLVTVTLAIGLSRLAATYVSRPILDLTRAMHQLSRGDVDLLLGPGSVHGVGSGPTVAAAAGGEGETWGAVGKPSDLGFGVPAERGSAEGRAQALPVGDEIAQLSHAFGDIIRSMKQKTDALAKSEERLRLFFDYDPNPLFLVDMELKRILDVNEPATRIFQANEQALLATPFLELFHPDDAERLANRAGGCALGDYFFLNRLSVKRKGREAFFIGLHARVVDLRDFAGGVSGLGLIVRTIDITERLEQESQLIQAGKMATLGEMATGVAHELNQPLNVLKVGADFFRKSAERAVDIPHQKLLTISRNMSEQVDRASAIIDHLREFGRKSDHQLYLVDVNEPVRGAFTLMGQQLRVRNIEVELDLAKGLPRVRAHKNRLEQVFLNLITNARDAMAAKGEGELKRLTVRTFREGSHVVAQVSDTGCGMTEQVRERIFEPFFTTKNAGEGTGLGLSITYNLVRDFHGSIDVESMPGQGTTFRIRLPACEEGEAGP